MAAHTQQFRATPRRVTKLLKLRMAKEEKEKRLEK